ncbi:MAG TPA: hypothetical protein VK705_10475 [Ferruginibacter sp.]|jgi:hypothetical protein|nr:hypothetical protein [Ferruginibacter sp.]
MTLLLITYQDVAVPVTILLLGAMTWLLFEFYSMKNLFKERLGLNNETIKLRLQAYERLTLFAERAAFKNIVSRTPYNDMNVLELQLTLIQTLRSEYDYNTSQQIYVSADMWKAISNLRDQNIYIINQVAATLPSHEKAIELSKRLLEYASINPQAELSNIVLEALQFEAKKIL